MTRTSACNDVYFILDGMFITSGGSGHLSVFMGYVGKGFLNSAADEKRIEGIKRENLYPPWLISTLKTKDVLGEDKEI